MEERRWVQETSSKTLSVWPSTGWSGKSRTLDSSIGVYTINQLPGLWICVLGRSYESLVSLVVTMDDVVLVQIVQIFILLIRYGEVVW
jgi:hypothetical protein